MANFNDLFDRQLRRGMISNQTGNIAESTELVRTRAGVRSLRYRDSIQIIDPAVDLEWANGYEESQSVNSYLDYFYSGQDIKVYVDGLDNDPEFRELPLIQLGWKVEQQKVPVYGFWSYTYDAVMRGTRLIQGTFTIATKSPDYMKRLVEAAAYQRSSSGHGSYRYHRGLTDDDENIEKYWRQTIDPAVRSAGHNLFSSHPPFSFVIVHGVQNVSVSNTGAGGVFDYYERYNSDTPLMTDVNERLVESDPQNQANRTILDAVELIDMSTEYGPDGDVVAETYTFFARDNVVPVRRQGNSGRNGRMQAF